MKESTKSSLSVHNLAKELKITIEEVNDSFKVLIDLGLLSVARQTTTSDGLLTRTKYDIHYDKINEIDPDFARKALRSPKCKKNAERRKKSKNHIKKSR